MFDTMPQRMGLYVAAAAVLLSAPTVQATTGGLQGLTAIDAAETAETDAATHPFVLADGTEVTFRSRPGFGALLWGDQEQVHAVALLNTSCDVSPYVEKDTPHKIALLPRSAHSHPQTVTVSPRTEDADGNAVPDVPACPVVLTADLTVASPARGWLLATSATTGDPVDEAVAAPYQVIRVVSPGGYGLLALSAFLVALAGVVAAITRGTGVTVSAKPFPVMAAMLAALAAVSAGTLAWTQLVPGLDLGGLIVAGLAGGVLVASGNALVESAPHGQRTRPKRWYVGAGIALMGTAAIALLVPWALLHGADIGAGSAVAWLAVVLMLCGLAVSRIETGPGSQGGAQVGASS